MKASALSLFALVLTPFLALAQQGPADLNTITRVEVRGTSVVITGTKKPNFTTFTMTDPARLVIDISEAVFSGVPEELPVTGGTVTGIRTASYGSEATAIARVLIGFSREVETDFQADGNTLVVKVLGDTGAAVAQAPAVQEPAQPTPGQPAPAQPPAAVAATPADAGTPSDAAAAARRETEAQQRAAAEAAAAAKADREAQERAAAEAAAAAKAEREAQARAAAEAQARTEQERQAAQKAEQARLAEAQKQADAQKQAEAAKVAQAQKQQQAEEARSAAAAKQAEAEAQKQQQAEAARAAAAAKQAEAEQRKLAQAAEAEARKQAAAERKAEEEANRRAEAERKAQAQAEAREQKRAAAEARKQAQAQARAAEAEEGADEAAAPRSGGARRNTMTFVGFKQEASTSRVFVRTSAPVRYSVSEGAEGTLILELENTRIALNNNTRALDTSFFDTAVAAVDPMAGPSRTVRIAIRLKSQVPYQARQDGNEVSLEFPRPTRR